MTALQRSVSPIIVYQLPSRLQLIIIAEAQIKKLVEAPKRYTWEWKKTVEDKAEFSEFSTLCAALLAEMLVDAAKRFENGEMSAEELAECIDEETLEGLTRWRIYCRREPPEVTHCLEAAKDCCR